MHPLGIHPFEKLLVWRRARALAVRIYEVTESWRDYGMQNQMRRAGVSIAANIAEGAGCASQREFARFLSIALGSAAELRGLAVIARDVRLFPRDDGDSIERECEELRRMLTALRTRVLDRENASSR